MSIDISQKDLDVLRAAKIALETPGFGIQVLSLLGMPFEKGIDRLPEDWKRQINEISHGALLKATEVALFSLDPESRKSPSDGLHKLAVSASGAAAGAFGLPALAVELPFSTTIMLRSIADIARSEGENLRAHEPRLACLEVFALGGSAPSDDAAESSYYVARTMLAKLVGDAAQFLAARQGAGAAAPSMVRLVTQVAARFGVQVSEKAAAQSVPIIGAAGGALVNNLFIAHFQSIARAHFAVRRLERAYSPELIRQQYEVL